MGREVQHPAADSEQASDRREPPPPRLMVRPPGDRRRLGNLLGFVRGVAQQHGEVGGVQAEQHQGVDPAERSLVDDHQEVQQRRQQPHDFHRVLGLEADHREPRVAAACALREGVHEIDRRPAESQQQPDRAGEVRDGEVGPLRIPARFPRDHRLHGELGQRLQPREQREGEALRHEKLRRLGAPGHQERRAEDAREGPQRRQRRAGGPSRRGE